MYVLQLAFIPHHAEPARGNRLFRGSDWWQPARIADAYQAAQELGAGFKMFLSIDMAAISCDGNR
jgi:glucan endo-1,3-alpha-glucosidase